MMAAGMTTPLTGAHFNIRILMATAKMTFVGGMIWESFAAYPLASSS
jgi:hypothetical protein